MAMKTRIWLWGAAFLVLAAAFAGYLQPGLLLDYLNLRFCG
jgi:hypothetical protein